MELEYDFEEDSELTFAPVHTLSDDSKPYAAHSSVSSLHPMPTRRRRAILRWILLGLHVLLFAGAVFGFGVISSMLDDTQLLNAVRFGVPAWALIVVAHLLLVFLLDARESWAYARRERLRREEIEAQIKRSQMLQQFFDRPNKEPAEELYPL
jgi:hypothetical protein